MTMGDTWRNRVWSMSPHELLNLLHVELQPTVPTRTTTGPQEDHGGAVFFLVFQGQSFKDLLFGLLAKREYFTVSG